MHLATSLADPAWGRQHRRLLTFRSIEQAGWELFHQKGFAETTVDQIAARAGISGRTFFRYFDSKEALLFGDWRWQLDELSRRVQLAATGTTPLDAIKGAVLALAESTERDRDAVQFRSILTATSGSVKNYYRQVVQPSWEDAIARALAERLRVDVDADLRPRLVAGIAIAALNAAMTAWVASDFQELLPELTSRAFELSGDLE
ncbi:MAG: TetR family transcriptional regulator [Actinomycetota bacterium]|nr:TetR family transcriptional regulator [Actinomycetota bacterium]